MPQMNRPGAQVYYDVVGDLQSCKHVLTLVNGHTRSSGDFRNLARYLEGFNIASVLLDNRAAGRSEVSREFTLEEMEDDVVSIWKELGLKKSCLLGISMGGFISQGISIRYPEYVDKLILVSTANDAKWIKSTGGGWVDNQSDIEQKLASYFAPGFVERNQLLFDTMVKQTKQAITSGAFAKKSAMQKDAVYTVSGNRDLAQIKALTLIVHGDQDQVIDERAADVLVSSIPNSKKKIYSGIGHLILAESPKQLYEDVAAFIDSKS